MKLFVSLLAAGSFAYEPKADVISGTEICNDIADLKNCLLRLAGNPFTYTHTGEVFSSDTLPGCDAETETRTFVNGLLKSFPLSGLDDRLTQALAPSQFLIANLPAVKNGQCNPIAYIADATMDCPGSQDTPITISSTKADENDSTGNSVIFVSADLATADATKSLIIDLTDCLDTAATATNEMTAFLQYSYYVSGAASVVATSAAALLALAAIAL